MQGRTPWSTLMQVRGSLSSLTTPYNESKHLHTQQEATSQCIKCLQLQRFLVLITKIESLQACRQRRHEFGLAGLTKNLPLTPKKTLKSSRFTFRSLWGKPAHQAISLKLQIWKLCKQFGNWIFPFTGIKRECILSC